MKLIASGSLRSPRGRRIAEAPKTERTRAWFCHVTDPAARSGAERLMGYDNQYRITMDGDVKYFSVVLKSACALIIRDDEFYLFDKS